MEGQSDTVIDAYQPDMHINVYTSLNSSEPAILIRFLPPPANHFGSWFCHLQHYFASSICRHVGGV